MRALITGISGQDGSYLAEFLLKKGYQIYGLVRRNPDTMQNLQGISGRVNFLYGDLKDSESLSVAIHKSWPDEIYNLGAQSFVPPSWTLPEETFDTNAGGLARILSVVERRKPDTKVYQASSSEMFGDQGGTLNESSTFAPTSPYGVSKLSSHHLIQAYRLKGIRCVSGILFNHESERRGLEMATMKIARHVARFSAGASEILHLGNTKARRDWGHAEDYVEAMWMMLRNADSDYVIGTGSSPSVDEFLDQSLAVAGVDVEEFRSCWLVVDPALIRDGEINILKADASRAEKELGWKPKVSFGKMVERMVRSEIAKATL